MDGGSEAFTYTLALPNGLEALMVHGGHTFMLVNIRSSKQQMIQGTSINNMEASGCSYRPDNKVMINVARSN